MRRPRRRPTYYLAITLNDGTVMAARPIRKPSRSSTDRSGPSIDPDGVAEWVTTAGKELSDVNNPNRFRFLDLLASNLNTRDALRTLVLPAIESLRKEISELRVEIARSMADHAHGSRA